MASNESKNEMLVMVLTDLAGICKKLAENSAVLEKLRAEARRFGEEFDSLSPYRGRGTAAQHFEGEQVIVKIARFLTGSTGSSGAARSKTIPGQRANQRAGLK